MTTEAKPSALAERLRKAKLVDAGAGRIPRQPEGAPAVLSFAQERLWFMEQVAPGTAAYNSPVLLHFTEPIDVPLLQQVLNQIATRHESLRTRYSDTGNGSPTLEIVDGLTVALTVLAAPPEGADALIARAAGEPFDLTTGALFRAVLVQVTPQDQRLLLVLHHIASDGWSDDIIVGELRALYRSLRLGAPMQLEPVQVRYRDFAAWQRTELAGPSRGRLLDHWRAELAGVPPLELPTDRPRPARQRFDGASYRFDLDYDGIDQLAARHGVTRFMVMHAALQVLLARHSGQDDFAIGSPVAGRLEPQLDRVVGMFVNMMPVRARIAGDPTFTELLSRTKTAVLDSLSHQQMPFEQLVNELGVARDVSRSPIFQVMLSVPNYDMRIDGHDGAAVSLSFTLVDVAAVRYDLELHALRESAVFNYSTALFDERTIAELADRLDRVLRAAIADPQRQVSALPMLSEREERQVTAGFNATAGPFPDTATLAGLVSAQAARAPDTVAVRFEGADLSYRELDERAARVARSLRERGIGPGDLVGVCAQRSLELVAGLLGVLQAGAGYVPLDPEYPVHRLAFMAGDCGARVILTASDVPSFDTSAERLDLAELISSPAEQSLSGPARPDDIAYAIYTSGSTGQPKGVPNTHRGIVNRIDWMQRTYRLGADDVVLQKTPASFDVSVWEFFWPLITGARLLLARPGGHRDAGYLRELIVTEGVTTIHFVPSMLTLFLAEAGIERLTSLRRAVCSGEELPVAAARDFLQRLPGCRLDNLYGPTESAIDVSYWQCTPDRLAGRDRVPIGAPIQNVELYVLDRAGHPVPRGIAGELYIGGVGLATGYLNRPELTAERFVDSPFGRLYRTGDLARWNRDGDDAELDYLGRIDFQVKLRGQRIELGEIEQVLRGQPGVSDAVVVVHDFGPSAAPDKRLVAYVTGAADDLRDALKAQLPDYMVPSSFTVLDEFPLSPNGKLDRAALPEPQSTRTTSTLVEPRTDIERVLAGIWCELIGLEQVGIEDDFFDLGGHSLLATQVVARLRPHLPGGKQVGVMDVFTHRTIRELAAMITSEEPQGPRQLLYRLTKPVATALVNYVCVPYGGGSAAAYQPVADALPAGHSLYALAIPGHDVGLDEVSLPFDELAHRCVAEVLERVDGPLVLYGHCGVGGALIIEVARQLEAAGRSLEAVYAGAIFPFAKPRGTFGRLAAALEKMESNRGHANWLRSHGVAMDELDPEQADRIISNMRHDSKSAEHFFTNLLDRQVTKLNAPVISVVGQRDPVTDYWQERYREWGFITDTTAVVVLEEAGHFFLKYRADELVEILTRTHPALGDGARELTQDARGEDARWWLHELHRADDPGPRPDGRQPATPSMRRYLTVASGQILSLFGTSLTRWAFPVWVYLQTGSVFSFGLMAGLMLLPGIVVAPFAGAIIDRVDRRQVLITASITAGSIELFLAGYLMLDYRPLWPVFALIMALSGALAFQRIGYQSAIPQLAPKRYLGHINGVDQMINGTAELAMPMLAAALVSVIDLQGILIVDICSYLFAVSILMAVRFPQVMGWRPREPLLTQIANGFRFSWRSKGFRSLLIYFSLTNLCIGPTIVAITPLVLSFSTVGRMGQVSLACALGIVVGGAIIATWGGPKRRRVLGVLAATVITALSAVLAGLHQSLPIIMAGGFGMELGLALENGIYQTMVQVKVPQRYHGRVFATNQLIAWSTLPISYALIAPYSISLANSMLGEHGVLAHNVGAVIGTGPGRGIGLTISFYGLVMLVIALVALRVRPIARFDDETPDALPDDLVGAQVVSERVGSASGPAPTERVLAEAGAS